MLVTLSLFLSLFCTENFKENKDKVKINNFVENQKIILNNEKTVVFYKMPTKLIKIK